MIPSGDSALPSQDIARAGWPRLHGFELQKELGRGGMGVVYQARQTSTERPVAVKVLRDGHADEQQRARFRIEAEAASRMQHPGIVQLYEFGEHEGRPYLVMELVSGGSLGQLLQRGSLSPAKAAALVRSLALAMEHAHGQRIVHRDLKPANILLEFPVSRHQQTTLVEAPATAEGDWDCAVKISDFGLAKRLDGDSTAWTRDGAVLGTAAYMAPEQAAGRPEAIGPATDIYSLGAILYELLTGRPPFQAESWQQVVLQVLHDLPDAPRELRPELPAELEAICLQCLEKSPERRYPSAQALADDLQRHLTHRSVSVQPLSEEEQLRRYAELDGFRIAETIGHGPCSEVYRAVHAPLQRSVALKVFARGSISRPAWEARLRQGAELWAAIPHPQIIPVQQAGWWNGRGYVAMEYVPQGNLIAKMAGQPASPAFAIDLVLQIADVVGYLHRQGVVHGNLKPANVLLAGDGIPRLTDFRITGGLYLGAIPAEVCSHADYRSLPPELAANPQVDPRPFTDVFGLGRILQELLAGQPLAAAMPESQETDPHLNAIVRRCLHSDPWRRYRRVFDLQASLRRVRDRSSGRLIPGKQGRLA